jgi:CubicO group peptidase (beta-lactamase class C family)
VDRSYVAAVLFGWVLLLAGDSLAATVAKPTGCMAPVLEPFDAEMAALMTKWEIPGASLAVAHDGRLLLAHGYGLADEAAGAPVTPATKFRLGSMAKPIAAVAVLKLVEDGRLGLDDKMLALLGELAPRPEAIHDPRVYQITVRQLLQHTAGFDRGKSGDPMFMPRATEALARQGATAPPTCEILLRDTLEGKLDFDPGTRFAYSNLGYCILGRIVERITGMPYLAVAQTRVLEPSASAGIVLGHTMERATGETVYYDYPGAAVVKAMPGVAEGMVAEPYGAYAVESMDSYGGWIGSPIDYLRFLLAIDGARGPALLSQKSLRQMRARPDIPGLIAATKPAFYGLGMSVRELNGGGENWWHDGSQPGAVALALRTAIGHSWVVAFNTRPRDQQGFFHDFDQALWAAARRVGDWPKVDLFDSCVAQ